MKKRLFALAGALLLASGNISAEAVQALTSRLFAGVDTVQAAIPAPVIGGVLFAVLTCGACGFGMGATPNTMVNRQALCDRYEPSGNNAS